MHVSSFWLVDRFLPGFAAFVVTFPAVMTWNYWLTVRRIERAARRNREHAETLIDGLKEHLRHRNGDSAAEPSAPAPDELQ